MLDLLLAEVAEGNAEVDVYYKSVSRVLGKIFQHLNRGKVLFRIMMKRDLSELTPRHQKINEMI